ncbi:hypothetical protein CLOSTMETH_02064 [[Clostridium] methylpentosum DSM 5476]|uniref:Uncharacterized protein n=1 Tax=[Clostridium] methylpentosum DSM 5476 TaxID=537013 RepID=C0EDY5_9FIRM|nr:hypothetical protein CLOSTMETH_02064 [[Clostridium] methylpentosum DSM 5476]
MIKRRGHRFLLWRAKVLRDPPACLWPFFPVSFPPISLEAMQNQTQTLPF